MSNQSSSYDQPESDESDNISDLVTDIYPGLKEIPVQELSNIISSLCNSELKSLLLIAMNEDEAYSDWDLTVLMSRLSTIKPKYLSHKTLGSYCRSSFADIGMVAREVIESKRGEVIGYSKTELGKYIGEALAYIFLKFSLDTGISLFQLFGSTASPGALASDSYVHTRVPWRTISLLQEIMTSNLITTNLASLITRSNLGETALRDVLMNLNRLGIVTYNKHLQGEEFSFYIASKDISKVQTTEPVYEYTRLTPIVLEYFQNNPNKRLSIEEVNNEIMKTYRLEKDQKSAIAHILRELAKRGILINESDRGSIVINQEFVSPIIDLLNSIEKIRGLDWIFIQNIRRLARGLIRHSDILLSLINRARENSPYVNKSKDELIQIILSELKKRPGLRTTEIVEAILQSGVRKTIDHSHVSLLLRELRRKNQIAFTGDRNTREYSIVEEQ